MVKAHFTEEYSLNNTIGTIKFQNYIYRKKEGSFEGIAFCDSCKHKTVTSITQ